VVVQVFRAVLVEPVVPAVVAQVAVMEHKEL
jgi:hypothetical protein